MGFFDSLAANPRGSSVYGGPGGSTYNENDALEFKKNKDQQDMETAQKMANFNSNLQLRQERLRNLYANPTAQYGTPGQPNPQPNVVFKDNNPDITPLQGAQLDVQKERFADERGDRAFAQGQAAQRTNIAAGQLDLDKKKNQQIFDTKQADLERKATDAANRESIAWQTLQNRKDDAAAQRAHADAKDKATEARHALEISRKDAALEQQRQQFQDKYDQREREFKNSRFTKKVDTLDPNKNTKTTETTKGEDDNSDDDDPLGILEK